MADREDIIRNITSHYIIQVMKAFNEIEGSSQAVQTIAKSLNELYRYFEPAFFNGQFYLIKNFNDKFLLDRDKGTIIYDKNILLNRTNGLLVIQVLNDGTFFFWENQPIEDIETNNDSLIYFFEKNREFFYANGSVIDLTIYPKGSRFATQFTDLISALNEFGTHKIYQSSCPLFIESWSDSHRLFFRGGGRGNNIPEKFMQSSLDSFLSTYLARGITIESVREYNLNGDFSKPKPVDVKITWREANRVAIIEIKFLGTVKTDDGKTYNHKDPRANEGITQLKGYHDAILSDAPTSIIKSYLLVIDGRRHNLKKDDTTIDYANGMYYKDVEIAIDDDKKFHESIPGFEKPIKVFAAPIIT